jgi:hypothetical protein
MMSNPYLDQPQSPAGSKDPAGRTMENVRHNVGIDPNEAANQLLLLGPRIKDAKLDIAKKKAELSAMRARHESRGGMPAMWDHERKLLLAELMETERGRLEQLRERELEEDGKATTKVVEAALDSFAHGHPRYRTFVTEGLRERQNLLEGEAELDKLYAELADLDVTRQYYAAAARIGEELVRYDRALMGV